MIAGLLAGPFGRWLIPGAILLAIVGAVLWLRSDAASDQRNKTIAETITNQKETRHDAESQAREVERSGSAGRLRDGNF